MAAEGRSGGGRRALGRVVLVSLAERDPGRSSTSGGRAGSGCGRSVRSAASRSSSARSTGSTAASRRFRRRGIAAGAPTRRRSSRSSRPPVRSLALVAIHGPSGRGRGCRRRRDAGRHARLVLGRGRAAGSPRRGCRPSPERGIVGPRTRADRTDMATQTFFDFNAMIVELERLEQQERKVSAIRRQLHDRLDSFPNDADGGQGAEDLGRTARAAQAHRRAEGRARPLGPVGPRKKGTRARATKPGSWPRIRLRGGRRVNARIFARPSSIRPTPNARRRSRRASTSWRRSCARSRSTRGSTTRRCARRRRTRASSASRPATRSPRWTRRRRPRARPSTTTAPRTPCGRSARRRCPDDARRCAILV